MEEYKKDVNTDEIDDNSIFKLSEEELYGEEEEKTEKKKPMKKSTRNMIILIIVTCLAIFTAVVALLWGVGQSKAYKTVSDNYAAAVAKQNDYENKISELNNKVQELTDEINKIQVADTVVDSDAKYPAGTKLVITQDGHMQGIRLSASVDAESLKDANGAVIYVNWGEEVKLVADATVDTNGNYWGKIDKGYIRITWNGETWAAKA